MKQIIRPDRSSDLLSPETYRGYMEDSIDNMSHVVIKQVPVEDLEVDEFETSVKGGAKASGKGQRDWEPAN